MEIISYVGAAGNGSAQKVYKKQKPVRFEALPRKTSFPLKVRPSRALSRLAAKHMQENRRFELATGLERPGLFTRAAAKIRYARKSDIQCFLLCALIAVLVPVTLFRAYYWYENNARPVSFKACPESELEFLNAAMTKFAMESTSDGVDDDGNVLAADGTILTPASVGVGQVVSYDTYKVQSGDTISSIALRFGLTNISTLIAVNDIDNVRTLRTGQKLRIPSQDGLIHRVGAGETLNGISVKYGVSLEEILDANDLGEQTLFKGQELFIPGAKMDAKALRQAMGELFIYPIKAAWRLTSKFGYRADPFTGVKSSHTGIDMACQTGTPIYAAMSGKVVYVGWSNIFGNYAIINHENGYQTLYGHMSKTLVSSGQRVSQGTRIGLVGSTGYSTGPHLHFTVYKNGKLVDPQTLLK